METRLRHLFALQKVDLGLNELEEMKGDLPFTVKKLQESLDSKLHTKAELEHMVQQTIIARDATDVEILALKERIEKYKGQQFQVKTNKQYDALTREIELSQVRIIKLQAEMEAMEGKMTVARNDAEQLTPEITELETELGEKIVARIAKADYQMYERIRKAKDGRAVVPVKRNSCGGCFNRVPPQKILELRKNDTLMTCERCGRILVSDDIVENSAAAE
ncbi:MAG: C4-type zinc ribbon domain-containing protein [Bacteroidetes bacterium]|nr:C4-type zinc ribbon domain-containing protein [Bacteroidota bacterium]